MIRLVRPGPAAGGSGEGGPWRAPGPVLHVELAPGSSAYLDAEWLGVEEGMEGPALVVGPDHRISWAGDGPEPAAAPPGLPADELAALVLLAVAREAASAVGGLPPGAVEVLGEGIVAHLVRGLLGATGRAGAGGRGAGGDRDDPGGRGGGGGDPGGRG
ncbi:MAG: hypothetical protein ACRD0L_08310, partial [Acidimicrobiales bacterium]